METKKLPSPLSIYEEFEKGTNFEYEYSLEESITGTIDLKDIIIEWDEENPTYYNITNDERTIDEKMQDFQEYRDYNDKIEQQYKNNFISKDEYMELWKNSMEKYFNIGKTKVYSIEEAKKVLKSL